jgi:Protein of unknown function (DUF3800)
MISPSVYHPVSLSRVYLEGEKLVRYIYMDESGISSSESVVVVAGVIINADLQWRNVVARIQELIAEYVPPEAQQGFTFHAKDLFHGAGKVFDRRKYPLRRSREVLRKLLAVPREMNLPIVVGFIRKQPFAIVKPGKRRAREEAARYQSVAFALCAIAGEAYMREYADPSEIATLIAENNDDTQRAVKDMYALLSGKPRAQIAGVPAETVFNLLIGYKPEYLPIRRIIDSVHHTEKEGAILLQLADAAALVARYYFEKKPNVDDFFDALTGDGTKALSGNEAPGGLWLLA